MQRDAERNTYFGLVWVVWWGKQVWLMYGVDTQAVVLKGS